MLSSKSKILHGVRDKMIIKKIFNKNCNLKKGNLLETERVLIVMRAILIAVVVGCGPFLVSSCATVPTGPLTEGEVRLLSIQVPGNESVRVTVEFPTNLTFQADGNPEIKRACFYWSGDGPYCYYARNVDYGPPGRIQIWSRAPVMQKMGSYRLEGYVEYLYNGKPRVSNTVNTAVNLRY
jgi:hypothetical protein